MALTVALLFACSDPFELGTDGPLLFKATVDGLPWIPDKGANTSAHLTPAGVFVALAVRRDTLLRARDGIGFRVSHLTAPGTYPFASDLSGDWGAYATYDPVNLTDTIFISTPPKAGHLEVTEIDTVNHRIAGRFEFEAVQLAGTREVRVTSGVFRLEYDTTPF